MCDQEDYFVPQLMNIEIRHRLAFDIRDALHSITWPSTYEEPDYVAKLVTKLPRVLQASLTALLPRRKILVGGAFIHQKPLARFLRPPKPGLRNPELGDLLIVCREQRASGYVYNALLFQAKCVDNVFHTSVPMDHQFILYAYWPEFEYVKASSLNGVRRNVSPKTITQGAQYLLIDKENPIDMFTATVDNPLEGTTCFPWALASVIAFDRGRTFQCEYPRDMWSNVIWDLLKISANAVFNRRHAGYNNTGRWSGDSAFDYLLKEGKNEDIPFIDAKDDNGDISGVSVICVDLGVAEDKRKLEYQS